MGVSVDEHLDEELAELTNLLLEKRMKTPTTTPELRGLDEIVYQLDRVIQPDVPPSPSFRARLTQRLIEEWNVVHNQQKIRPFSLRPPQLAALAASVAVVLLVTVLLLNNGESGPLSGTAAGNGGGLVFALVALAAAGVAAFVFWRRHR